MRTCLASLGIILASALCADAPLAHPHSEIKEYSLFGNCYKAVATKAMGAKQFEVWKSSLGVGSKTPRHVHETEEVFIILKGHVQFIIGEQRVDCVAPATMICPAHIPHELINVGEEPTEQIAIMGIGSKICDANEKEMTIPWR